MNLLELARLDAAKELNALISATIHHGSGQRGTPAALRTVDAIARYTSLALVQTIKRSETESKDPQ